MTALAAVVSRPTPCQGLQVAPNKQNSSHPSLPPLTFSLKQLPVSEETLRFSCQSCFNVRPSLVPPLAGLQTPNKRAFPGGGVVRSLCAKTIAAGEADGGRMAGAETKTSLEHPLVYISFYKFASLPDYEQLRLAIKQKCDEQV